jgi:TolB-like protein
MEPGITDNSIAVLPFVNMSRDPEQQYFSDGVAHEILNALAGVQGLKVTARKSSFQFRGDDFDVSSIGKLLNVATVLEGSVRRTGDTLRITAQLINTADGFHLWSRTYDRRLDDIFAIQDEIATSIVEEMRSLLNIEAISDAPSTRIATNTDAYDLYLRGLYQLNLVFAPGQQNTNIDAPAAALDYFSRSLDAATEFAPAMVGSARALRMLAITQKVPSDEAEQRIAEHIARALKLAPDLAEVQLAAAERRGTSAEEALAYIDRAIDINPNYGAAYTSRADRLLQLHRYRESFEAMEAAYRLDPLNMFTAGAVLYADFYQGRLESIDKRIKAMRANSPDANGLVDESHLRFELGQFDRFPALQQRADIIPGFAVESLNWVTSAPRHFGDTYLTLEMSNMARYWLARPMMSGRYDDAILLSEGRFDEAIEFLKIEFERGKGKPIYTYRWHPDIIASLIEAYLYAGRYEELNDFFETLEWGPRLFPLPNCCVTNPPWPEVAYNFALFQTGRNEQALEWLAQMVDELEHRLAEGIEVPNHYYELARLRVMQGRIPEAFAAMERAIDLGWRRWYFDLDPILEPIRKLPDFADLKVRYDADIQRMRDKVEQELSAGPATK